MRAWPCLLQLVGAQIGGLPAALVITPFLLMADWCAEEGFTVVLTHVRSVISRSNPGILHDHPCENRGRRLWRSSRPASPSGPSTTVPFPEELITGLTTTGQPSGSASSISCSAVSA